MKCCDIMTKNPITCSPTTSAEEVARLMAANDIGSIPVVSNADGDRLEGIITDRDLAVKLIAEGRDPKTTVVQDIMSAHLVVCGPDETADGAVQRMEKHNVRRIPVADRDNRLMGIIAISDIISRMRNARTTNELVSSSQLFCSHES